MEVAQKINHHSIPAKPVMAVERLEELQIQFWDRCKQPAPALLVMVKELRSLQNVQPAMEMVYLEAKKQSV